MEEITNFELDVLQSDKPVLVDFYTDWCTPCKYLKSILEKVNQSYSSMVKIVSMNITYDHEIASRYSILNLPCVIMFNAGNEVSRNIGLKSERDYSSMMDNFLGVKNENST